MDTLNINKSELTQKMGEAFANLINKSSKEDWKSEMKSGFNNCYEKIVDSLWKEGAIHVGAIQIDALESLDRNLQLFGLVVSAGIQSGILQLSEDNILSIVGDERVFQKNIRLPMMKPRKKYNKFPLGIKDVESILETMPLYFDEEFSIPFSEDVNLFSYTLGVNKGITLCNRELHIPCLHDFRGRMYAKTDVGNYTSDKVQRVHMLVEGMETCALDTRSSCILLTSLITKDNKALKGVFTLGNKTHKVDQYRPAQKFYGEQDHIVMDQADPVIGIAPVISYKRVIVDQIDHEGCTGGEVDDPAGSDPDPPEQFEDDHAEAQRNDAVFGIGAGVGDLVECVG